MTVGQGIRTALRALMANKLRAALTMLGIIIGVAAVIAMMSIGRGAQASITAQIQSMGSNLVFVRPGSTSQGGVRTAGSAPTLSAEDAEAIANPLNAPSVARVAPELNTGVQVLANGQNWGTRASGTTEEYPEVRNVRIADGEFISQSHVDARSMVVVLGATVAQRIFGEEDPIGQTIRVSAGGRSGVNLRVIGVLEPKGGSGFGNQDDQIFVPLTTMQFRLFASRTSRGTQNVSLINVQAVDQASIGSAVEEIGELLRERHRVVQDDFTIQSQEDTLQVANQITGVMTILLGSIAGISLLVGGIGIMNIMLVSVTERTREIGIRKAVGAKRNDILFQFLVESVVVSILGGTAGVLGGAGIARLVSGLNFNGQQLQTLVATDAIALAFGVSAGIGLFFGIYPAWRAANLDPIEALRYE